MRWFRVKAVVLAAVALAGCPSEFGKDGRIDKAVEKDVQEQFERVDCTDEYIEAVCNGPHQDRALCEQCRK